MQSYEGKTNIYIRGIPTKWKDKRQIYIVRVCFMYTKNLSHVGRGQEFFFFPPFSLLGKGPFRFLFSVKLSVCGDRHPKGSVKIETSLFPPKQLIHRKGNRPLLNFLSIRLTASRGHTTWKTAVNHEYTPCGGKEKGRKKERKKKRKRVNKFTREDVRSCVSILLNIFHHWHPRFSF